jgi:hypothetical protein
VCTAEVFFLEVFRAAARMIASPIHEALVPGDKLLQRFACGQKKRPILSVTMNEVNGYV